MNRVVIGAVFGVAVACAAVACSNKSTETMPDPTGGSAGSTIVELPAALGGGQTVTYPAPNHSPVRMYPANLKMDPSRSPKGGTSVSPKGIPLGAPPPSLDISQHCVAVANQGTYGDCASFSSGYYGMGWWLNKTGTAGNPLAPVFVYDLVMKKLGTQCGPNGTSMLQDPLDVIQSVGIDTAADYPSQTCVTPTAAQVANAAKWRVSGYTTLDLTQGKRRAIENALSSGVPVVLGVYVYNEMQNADANNFLIDLPTSGQRIGGHAVAAFKYDAQGVWFENSWGKQWGKDGWAELTWRFIEGTCGTTDCLGDAVSLDGLASGANPPAQDGGAPVPPAQDAGPPMPSQDGGSPFPPPSGTLDVQFEPGGPFQAWTDGLVRVHVTGASTQSVDVMLSIAGPYGYSQQPMTPAGGDVFETTIRFGMPGQRMLTVTVIDGTGATDAANEKVDVQ